MSGVAVLRNDRGFTLAEVILVIIIAGILIGVALSSGSSLQDNARTEETKRELQQLAEAIVGNEELQSNGTRSDFGYVGDVGAMPPDLDALVTNPGYATWDGPYIRSQISQDASDYKTDSWGTAYNYSGGTEISSTGGGSTIARRLANSSSELLSNEVSGAIIDVDGSPPGGVYADSVTVQLTYPDGTGGLATGTVQPRPDGSFSLSDVPIGSHSLSIIYEPENDTLQRFVAITPGSAAYSTYRLPGDYWSDTLTYAPSGGGGGSELVYVTGTAYTGSGGCKDVTFEIENTTGGDITISSLVATWSSPEAYYKKILIDGSQVANVHPRLGSGETASFSSHVTIPAGGTVTVKLEQFLSNAVGGSPVDMSGVDITIDFSDGSSTTLNSGSC